MPTVARGTHWSITTLLPYFLRSELSATSARAVTAPALDIPIEVRERVAGGIKGVLHLVTWGSNRSLLSVGGVEGMGFPPNRGDSRLGTDLLRSPSLIRWDRDDPLHLVALRA